MATTDPQDRWRLVRVSTDLLSQFGTRTERGERITAEWGEPDAEGVYEPVFTVHADDRLCSGARPRGLGGDTSGLPSGDPPMRGE